MTTTNPAPSLDPESGAPWREISDLVFSGGGPRIDAASLDATRAAGDGTCDTLLAGRAFTTEDLQIPGPGGNITLSVFTPESAAPGAPALLWLHGGGMIAGNRFNVIEALDPAEAVGAIVISPEYRLSPEHPAPAPGDDCYATLCWVAEHAGEIGADPTRLILAGTSAGGGLAAGAALRARDDNGPTAAGLLLACPMLDDRMTTVSSRQFDDGVLWTRPSNEFGWQSLLGERAGTDDVSIYEAPGRTTDHSSLPPTFVDVGSADLFRDEDVAFASGIWSCGGDAELHVWPGGYHGFELLAPTATLSIDAFAARRRWVTRRLANCRP